MKRIRILLKVHLLVLVSFFVTLLIGLAGTQQRQVEKERTEAEIVEAARIIEKQQDRPVPVPIRILPSHRGGIDKQRSRRYDGFSDRGSSFLEVTEDTILYRSHGRDEPSPLPVSESDAVVVGEILEAQPFLSSDETTTYTEFKLRIERVLKHPPLLKISTGQTVKLTRVGGALQLPSGNVVEFKLLGQGLPLVTGRYLLFLREYASTQDFEILTGQLFADGTAFPLDSTGRLDAKGRLPYTGKLESELLSFVETEIERAARDIQ